MVPARLRPIELASSPMVGLLTDSGTPFRASCSAGMRDHDIERSHT